MFYDCSSLTNIDLSNWNTSNVTDMSSMFYNCKSLTNIDLSSWNTSNVTDMSSMFYNCSSLTNINLSNWNTRNVTDMYRMFYNCSSLTNIDLSSWNVSSVETTYEMFSNCSSLANVNLSNWNTSNLIQTSRMFYNCKTIEQLDVSTFDISRSGSYLDMFEECSFNILVTPKATSRDFLVSLPYIMYDEYGEEYIFVPTTSKTLYKERPNLKYNITLKTNGGIINSGNISEYTGGTGAILPTDVSKVGYTFSGWYDNEELTGSPVTSISATETGDKTFYAKWIANTNTPYKVIHHFRNLDTEVEGYNEEEELKTGTTDATVEAEYKQVEGFTKNESDSRTVKEGTVAGDGSLVLHLYYARNTYNIVYELNGGTTISSLTNKYIYGKEMILQTKVVTKQGYVFAGWYDNEELTGSPVTSISATSTGDKTFYAKWVEEEKEYYILSEAYNIDLTENIITKVSPETSVTNFLSEIETNGQKKVVNAKGEEVTNTTLVGTGYKLQVTFKGEVHTYEIAVRGDLDGNGKITTTDLSIINQQILHKIELTGIKAKAADTDFNGNLTTTDLSMINQAVLRKITL